LYSDDSDENSDNSDGNSDDSDGNDVDDCHDGVTPRDFDSAEES